MKYAIFALLAPLAACSDKGGDSGGTGSTDGTNSPPVVDSYSAVCADSETYEGTLTTTTSTDGAGIIDMWETNSSNGWNEEHFLVSDNADDTELTLSLTQTSDIGSVTTDEPSGTGFTLFGCGTGEQFTDSNTMTYAIRVYDTDGTFSDCAAFGVTPEIVAAGGYITTGGSPSSASELNSCHVENTL